MFRQNPPITVFPLQTSTGTKASAGKPPSSLASFAHGVPASLYAPGALYSLLVALSWPALGSRTAVVTISHLESPGQVSSTPRVMSGHLKYPTAEGFRFSEGPGTGSWLLESPANFKEEPSGLPSGTVAETSHSQYREPGFAPWSGN